MLLQNFKDNLSRNLYVMTTKEANEKGICIQCREKAIPKCYSEAGKKEFYISGLCELCFDSILRG
uniref:Uncharacterized protein n=1 Tax=viral metagenome TaxID=1070528 RepID=A0A6M3KIF7_9ZZZZ